MLMTVPLGGRFLEAQVSYANQYVQCRMMLKTPLALDDRQDHDPCDLKWIEDAFRIDHDLRSSDGPPLCGFV